MTALLFTLAALSPVSSEATKIESLMLKVGPNHDKPGRTKGQARAVVLIHGLMLRPIFPEKVIKPQLRYWQQHDSALVKRLAKDSDVYGIAYSQNVSVEELASSAQMHKHLQSLKDMGYTQIVLMGHSAGGLIARQLVEDNTTLGITRVIQVCAPNGGSGLAALKTARAIQIPFLVSITRASRQKVQEERAKKRIPDSIAFACVVGTIQLRGDGVVASKSQWTSDLQLQGIPAFGLLTSHWDAMSTTRSIELLSRLVIDPLPRWDTKKVEETRKQLIGN